MGGKIQREGGGKGGGRKEGEGRRGEEEERREKETDPIVDIITGEQTVKAARLGTYEVNEQVNQS